MPVTIDAGTRLLVVAPHPDDESIGTGELIQHVRAAGGTVDILLLTAGDNNPWPQRWLERRLRIGSEDRRRWGERRRQEVAGALARLGLPQEALHPLGLPDMGLTACLREDLHAQLRSWAGWLEQCRPNLLALPALGDGHPDHSAAHVLMRLAVAQWLGQGASLPMLSYLVHGRAAERGESVALPSSAACHATKLAALDEHRSQVALSGGRMRRLADRPEVFRTVEPGGCDGWLPWQPSAAQRPWLRLTLADRDGARSWPWSQAPLQRHASGRWRLLAEPASAPGPRFVKLHTELPSLWIFDRWGWCEL